MSVPMCTVCEAPWLPSCTEHPILWSPDARSGDTARAVRHDTTERRRGAARLSDAMARNPELAARYGVQS